jgi:hypothetical protein
MKYIFITHVDFIEVASDQYETEYHCNYYCRVDDLLEEFLMTQLADEEPSEECRELSRTINQLTLVSRFNPQRRYKMSIVIFDEDQQSIVPDILKQLDDQCEPTIKMIRQSGDTKDI